MAREHEKLRFEREEGPVQPKGASVDLSQLSLQGSNEAQVKF